jgi:hypothetical protein
VFDEFVIIFVCINFFNLFFFSGQNIKLHLDKKKLHVHKMTRVEKCGTSGLQTCGTHLQKLLQTRHTHIEGMKNKHFCYSKIITSIAINP